MNFIQLSALAQQVVASTQAKLPATIRDLARAVPVCYDQMPSDDVINEGFEPDILGLFSGSSHGTEISQDQPMPPQIFLYLQNLWDYAEGDPKIFREEVRLTYLHEFGHYLGWDEDDLTARGLD